jgi:ribosomal protein S18 acetylase RimI-like enzyme
MNPIITYHQLIHSDQKDYRTLRLQCLQCHPENFGTLYEEELENDSLKFDKIIVQNCTIDFLMGAFDKENLIGICGYIQEKRTKTRHQGEISQMHVSPSYQGKGIAKELLKLTISKAFSDSNLEFITLGVVHSNAPAIDLYQKHGFKQYGVLPNYYKNGGSYEDMVFMKLDKTEVNKA